MYRVITCISLSCILCGCASSRTDLVKTGYLSLQPTLTASLSHSPEVYERDGGLVVDGRLESSEIIKGGHVDIQVIAPDGTVVYDAAVNHRKPSSHSLIGPKGSLRGPRSSADSHATYSVRFPGLPPEGSVVRVKYDPQPHQTEAPK